MAPGEPVIISPEASFPDYLRVRTRENRILPDEAVAVLPLVAPGHPNAKEWNLRAKTLRRFQVYLDKNFGNKPLKILDLGCGNGWMAHHLAVHPARQVRAADVNGPELQQGARLFGRENLIFWQVDILKDKLPENDFDLIVLAASVQYFPDLRALIHVLKTCLKPGGEIHLLDSPFYADEAARIAARERSRQYYQGVGIPEMAQHYYHHTWPELRAFGAENLNHSLINKLFCRFRFPWVRIRVG
jgi:SAM-dependent methyltransferase